MNETKEKKFKDVFKENFSKEQRREVAKTVFKWYGSLPIKVVKKVNKKNLKAFGKNFIKTLKNIGNAMETKLKDAKISDYFKRSEKENNEVEKGKS